MQNIQQTKKCKFNHSVKLPASWGNYLWEVNIAFPPLCPLGYGGDGVGQQRLLVDVSSEGFLSHRDSEMLWLVAVSSLAHPPFLHWKNLCPNFFFLGYETGLGQDGTQRVILGIPERCWCSYCGQKSARWQPGKGDILTSPPLLTPSQCHAQDSLWLPKPWPTRFLIPEPQLINLTSTWNTQAPLCRWRSQTDIWGLD